MSKPTMVDYLELGLRAGNMRARSIANNIANLRTQNYRRVDVQFENLLRDRLKDDEPLEIDDVDLEFSQPRSTPVAPNGNDVSFDQEIAAMIKNTGRLKTYLRILKKNYEWMEKAMRTEG